LLALFVLLIANLSFWYYAWAFMTDNLGDFHKSTDLADLDGDGDLDVVLHNVRQEAESTAFAVTTLWFNQGEGRFVAQDLGQGTHGAGWDVVAGDVDRDGDADLLRFMGYELRLLSGQALGGRGDAGEFKLGYHIAGPARAFQYGSVLLGDLNRDEWPDGVVVGCCGRRFTLDPEDNLPSVSGVWLNRWRDGSGPGSMSDLAALDGLGIGDAALGDLDGDGDLDIFAAVLAPGEAAADRVILNDGTGHFADSGQRLGEGANTAVALGDLDGDGDLDALVGNEDGAMVWVNQGGAQGGEAGRFARAAQRITGDASQAIFLADLDQDGDRDALVAGYRRAAIWWNEGDGSLERSRQSFRYSKRHGLAVSDFNGDGRLDVFAAAYERHYRIWFNQGDGRFQRAS
jgi:hypothetical protein